ncbi:MAG: hypothetical protein IJK04_13485 [Kiritimatiellae bacterium]|nr:hypothetical protein [Kiritimatiellia bacterium]
MESTEKKICIRGVVFSTLAFAFVLALPASAGVKYWDNPDFKAFDVGDYVQDGLVANYDGIRNAGPDADHDPNAMTWVNCVDSAKWPLLWCSYIWNESTSKYEWKKSNTSEGEWASDGFVFDGLTYFAKWNDSNPVVLGPDFTYQFGTDGTISSQKQNTQYLIVPSSNWNYGGVGLRKAAGGGTTANSVYAVDLSINSSRPYFTAPGGELGYVNYIVDYSSTGKEYITDGASIPTASGSSLAISASPSKSYTWFSLGGFHSHSDPTAIGKLEGFTGTIHFFRIYSKALGNEELGWNRVVDEARYFHRRGVLPVTNAVVTANFPDVSGDTPNGTYAVDAGGYVFSAPASIMHDGRVYTLSGHTVETLSGGTWTVTADSDAVGAASVSVSANDCVRITWKWAQGDGIVTYDISDYVQDGLLVHYDGIRNVGMDVAHDSATSKWLNLGSGGASYDLTLAQKVAGDQGHWLDNGYRFEGNSVFSSAKHDGNWLTYTFQWVIDGKKSEQRYNPPYLFSASWNNLGFGMGDNPKNGCFHYNTQGASNRPYILNSAKEYTYATAISDADNKEIKFFEGTKAPTSGGIANGYYKFADDATMSALAYSQGSYNVAGYGSADGQFVGTIKNIRIYTRVLTDAELAHNRRVDNYRFFGIYEPETTNVVVQSTYSYLQGNEKAGPYEVEGSYTFTAPETVTAPNGITYACAGYTVETQDGTGWTALTSGTGNSYRYETSTGTVRLTWKWKATSGIRSAADYRFDDLSPAGLALHYDGLLNQGVGKDRSTTSTKWINLGSAGSSMNLSTQRKSGDTSAWGDKGYEYAGNTYFQSDVNTYVWGGSYSAQILADAKHADNKHVSGNYLAASTWNRFGMQVYGDKNLARSNVQGIGNDAMRVTYPTEDGIDYMTVIADAAAKVDYAFAGTKIPTGGTATAGYRPYTTQLAPYSNYFRLGGWGGGNNGQGLTGTIFTFRYYDRVLTEEELVRNRNVDAVRYFGALGVTNVVVAVEAGSGIDPEEDENGAYFVEGSHTFRASGAAGLGYRLSVPDGNGGWTTLKAFVEGDSYSYDKADADTPPCVKLEWRIVKPFMLIVR